MNNNSNKKYLEEDLRLSAQNPSSTLQPPESSKVIEFWPSHIIESGYLEPNFNVTTLYPLGKELGGSTYYGALYIDSSPNDFLKYISPDDTMDLLGRAKCFLNLQYTKRSNLPADELDKLATVLSKGKHSKECQDAVSVYRNIIFMGLDEDHYDLSDSPIQAKKGRFLSNDYKHVVNKFPPSIPCYAVKWTKDLNGKIKPEKCERLNPDSNVVHSKKRPLSSTSDETPEERIDGAKSKKKKAEPGDEFRNALSKYIDAHLRRTDDNKKYILMNEFLEEFRVHCEENENGLFNEHKDDMLSKQPNCSNKGKFNKMVLSILHLKETKRTSHHKKITNYERVS